MLRKTIILMACAFFLAASSGKPQITINSEGGQLNSTTIEALKKKSISQGIDFQFEREFGTKGPFVPALIIAIVGPITVEILKDVYSMLKEYVKNNRSSKIEIKDDDKNYKFSLPQDRERLMKFIREKVG